MAHHVIYVPGLGDHRKYERFFATIMWSVFGIKVHYLALGWQSTEPFDNKLNRLLAKIDQLQKDFGSVSLVGISAGASAVLNAYSLRKDVKNVVCICGKINNPQAVNPQFYKTNPPFKESVYLLQENLKLIGKAERRRIMSIHPIEDKTVPPKDTLIDGAIELEVPVRGHAFSIFYTVVFRAATICKFIKNT